jgi:hypothetical protein
LATLSLFYLKKSNSFLHVNKQLSSFFTHKKFNNFFHFYVTLTHSFLVSTLPNTPGEKFLILFLHMRPKQQKDGMVGTPCNPNNMRKTQHVLRTSLSTKTHKQTKCPWK